MNDMKNVTLNWLIGLGISTELLAITLVDVNDVLRIIATSCVIIGFVWKFHRQGMFNKKQGPK